MAFIGNFDATTVQPASEFSALPSGEYIMAITDSEMKSTKSGDGQYLQLTFSVVDASQPEHMNRKVFVRLNLINNNQTAVEIAQRELSAICHAVNVMNITDSSQLHDLPMLCKVAYVPAKGEYAESNKITAYKASGLAAKKAAPPAAKLSPPQSVTQPAPATAAQTAPKVAPWRTSATQ